MRPSRGLLSFVRGGAYTRCGSNTLLSLSKSLLLLSKDPSHRSEPWPSQWDRCGPYLVFLKSPVRVSATHTGSYPRSGTSHACMHPHYPLPFHALLGARAHRMRSDWRLQSDLNPMDACLFHLLHPFFPPHRLPFSLPRPLTAPLPPSPTHTLPSRLTHAIP